jgi:ligand-binding sensor domain-containing protein/signal transduction histidine kinase
MQVTRNRKRHLPINGLIVFILLVICPSALSLNPALEVNQYAHASWKIREGFSQGRIGSIAQTTDGYLWLSTDFDLLRFDGVTNTPFQPPPGQQLPSRTIMGLLASRDGKLWIGTNKGLASWDGVKLTQYPELDGQFVFALLEDHEGIIWAGGLSVQEGKLCQISRGRAECFQDKAFGRGIVELYEDKKRQLWIEGPQGLWRWKPGPPRFFPLKREFLSIRNLAEDSGDGLLIASVNGVSRFVDGNLEPYPIPGPVRFPRVSKIFRDRDGCLWLGTSTAGLYHVCGDRADSFSAGDGLSGQGIASISEDREGNIWVATLDGLDRFRDLAIPTLTTHHGLSSNPVLAVIADRDGTVWLTTARGMNRWSNGKITTFGRTEAENGPISDVVLSIFQDSRGRMWGSSLNHFGYYEHDNFVVLNTVPGGVIRSISEDRNGDLWIANQDHGLFHLHNTAVLKQVQWNQLGRKDFATSMTFDPVQGDVWLGFFDGGIAHFDGNSVQAQYGVENGLGGGLVNDLHVDADSTVWAATAGGLSRLKNGRIATLASKNGLPCDGVHWMRKDLDQTMWLHMACGLVRITRPEIERWTREVDARNNPNEILNVAVFDVSDGVRSEVYPSGYSPIVAQSSDGKLWFTTSDGVSVFDPDHLPFNSIPPPIHTEQVIADGKTYDVGSVFNSVLQLPKLVRNLQIDYTALSFAAPEKVRFRYMLEGWDRTWQEVGNRRQAFYTNLSPGTYTFRVIACNNDGVWNDKGSTLVFVIPPAFYQTYWFLAFSLLIVAALIWLLYFARIRQIASIYKGRMEERVQERERIARDLHDTFLQGVQGLILKFDAAAKQIPSDQPARRAMEDALDRADEVMAEGRDRVRNLRDATIGDLPAAFTRVVKETSSDGKITFRAVVEGRLRDLNPIVMEESYAIGREALINALTHSEGHNVETEITYDRRQFRLRIRDDGKGIDPKILQDGGRPDHYGLPGMRERAERIDAQLKLWSGADTGTEVELLVPASTAYRKVNGDRKRSWFKFQ